MPSYAYRWDDGTVSVCSARSRNDAALLFDEIAPMSRKLIIRLKEPLLVTLRPDIDTGWRLDEDDPIGATLDFELQKKCFPGYDRTYWKVMDMLEEKNESLSKRPDLRRKISTALQRDVKETQRRAHQTHETPHIVLLYPKGLPGQNN